MDKRLTVPKYVLIVQLKIPQMPQNLSAQFVYPNPKFLDFNEKRLLWASLVREAMHCNAMDKTKSFKGFTIIQRQSRTGILNGKELKNKSTIKENENRIVYLLCK